MPKTPASPIGRSPWAAGAATSTTTTSANHNRRVSQSNGQRKEKDDEDVGLMMKERDAESFAKTGGREVGVTRPKRRLSRAMSTTSSPPVSPANNQSHHLQFDSQQRSATQGYTPSFPRSPTNITRIDEKPPIYIPPQVAGVQERESGPPRLWGIQLKWISLVTLALQNAFLTIIMHYSRISTAPEKTYSAAAAVLLNELLKGGISTLVALKRIDDNLSGENPPLRKAAPAARLSMFQPSRLRALGRAIFGPDCFKLSVPAILYVIQNNLQYVAASNLDVATFQVTYQMKILTTAFFSVLMLGKRLGRAKWAALFLLAVGVGIVQLQSTSGASHSTAPSTPPIETGGDKHSLRADIPESSHVQAERIMHPFRGFIAVTLACMTSGLAGVYFELILKSGGGSAPDLWVRNAQLSLFSLIPALFPILFGAHDGMSWWQGVVSKFDNFSIWAWGTVLTQTFGGLITALVIRYSDNIMKGFATSISIIISFLASVGLFSYPITLSFVVGATIVLGATYLYNSPSVPDAPPTRTAIAVAPGSPIPTNAPIIGETQAPSRTSSVINLLGLGGSRPGSRRASATDLRNQYPMSGGNAHISMHELTRLSPGPRSVGGKKPQLTVDTGAHIK